MKTSGTEHRLRTLYMVAFILLLASCLITLYANREIIRQIAQVEHTNKVIRTLESVLSGIKDAETGFRGYIITGDTRFLAPYKGSKERTDSFYREAVRLTTDNPQQQQRLKSLKADIETRFELLRFGLGSFEENKLRITDTMHKLQPEAIRVMDNIRSTITALEVEEDRLLNERERRLTQRTKALNMITIISLSLAITLLFLGFVSYRQLSRARKSAQLEVENYQAQLKGRITELNKVNAELIRIRSMEKLAATGRIARAIAHEVRNPLTNINLATEQLKGGLPEKKENTEFLFEMINRNSSRINRLIADLLRSTKFSELRHEKIGINELLDSTLSEAADRIVLNNISLAKEYIDTPCVVSVDIEKMKIAFLNIIINAIEAMEKSDKRVLTISTLIKDKKCRVQISDTGSGIDSEAVARVFEAYYTDKPTGNGLGLTNTQNIILNHQGDISVESSKGKGSNFIITLDRVF